MSPSQTVMTMVFLILGALVLAHMLRKKEVRFPVPPSDRKVVLEADGQHVILGYTKATNFVSIWTPQNEPVVLCRSNLRYTDADHTVLKNTGSGSSVLTVRGTTTDGQAFTGYAPGPSIAGSDYQHKTGNRWLSLHADFWMRKLPGDPDVRATSPLDKVEHLVPPPFKGHRDRRNCLTWTPLHVVVDPQTAAVLAAFMKDTEVESERWLRDSGLSLAWHQGQIALHGK